MEMSMCARYTRRALVSAPLRYRARGVVTTKYRREVLETLAWNGLVASWSPHPCATAHVVGCVLCHHSAPFGRFGAFWGSKTMFTSTFDFWSRCHSANVASVHTTPQSVHTTRSGVASCELIQDVV